ncbi:FAD:protein FMN transferase [Arthrobacter sp. AK01]|uniref:FAD:protein FMN transferase n=1 Tax=Micrococcaceae TaxID=1268 RepID=UPI001E3BD30F|nr:MULTISPECIES: FAD:protein FMN transferase [Micrococcaceae]MCD4852667.1 FAD:protein FMN transferase [Arthrobacter sp. AK01]MCP1411137.1 thiamine biosynthesis lipoprotein [Paenarthrobacter sp. A20]
MQPTSNGQQLRARTFRSMGTVVSLTVASNTYADTAVDELESAVEVVEGVFVKLDHAFSLYRLGSEASRLARGELTLAYASETMRDLYAEASEWRLATEGAFTAERPDGRLDLSGIVKAHAVREAALSLRALGLQDWCVNAGGDVLVSGSPGPATNDPWLAGILDPLDRQALLGAFPLQSMKALATSGSAERGDHIWAVGGARPEFVQVSVAAADIVTADVLATAIVAGGTRTLDQAVAGWGVEVLAVRPDGELLATPEFRSAA